MSKYSIFGFKKIEDKIKQGLVYDIFQDVSGKYDLMNDLMCFGMHRLWKAKMLQKIYPIENKIILDVAGGTGDIGKLIKKTHIKSRIIICDINIHMMQEGRNNFVNKNIDQNSIAWVCGDAEALPIQDNSIDFYLNAFGIRNFNNISNALRESYRVLKPGGKFICLEFSEIKNDILLFFYKHYIDKIIPKIGKFVARNEDAYQYLADSIQTFPNQETFAQMIEDAGFLKVRFENLTKGIVAIHTAFKPLE